MPKAESSLGVIEKKRLNSEEDEPEPQGSKKNLILFDQAELNDLIRDLNLSKDEAELLRSQLKEKNLLNENVRISYYNQEKDIAKLFLTKTVKIMLLLKINYNGHCWSIC